MTTAESVDLLLIDHRIEDIELAKHAFRDCYGAKHILTITDGQEALDFLRAEGHHAGRLVHPPPKAIILSLNLPRMSGMEVLQQIKSDHKLKSIPVIIISSSDFLEDRKKSYQLGANSYILKTVDYERYHETFKRVCQYWIDYNETIG